LVMSYERKPAGKIITCRKGYIFMLFPCLDGGSLDRMNKMKGGKLSVVMLTVGFLRF